jgi:hypothetical protein
MRTVLAFLFAPLAPAAVALLLSFWPSLESWVRPGSLLFIGVAYGYPIAGFLGLPTYFYFRRKGWLRLWQALAAGALAGAAVPVAFAVSGLLHLVAHSPSSAVALEGARVFGGLLLYGVGVGCVAAFAFWLIAFAPITRTARDSGKESTSAA